MKHHEKRRLIVGFDAEWHKPEGAATNTILRAFRRGDLAGYKLGCRVVRFDPDEVKSWIRGGKEDK